MFWNKIDHRTEWMAVPNGIVVRSHNDDSADGTNGVSVAVAEALVFVPCTSHDRQQWTKAMADAKREAREAHEHSTDEAAE